MSPQGVARLALGALGGDQAAAATALAIARPESRLNTDEVGDEHLTDETWGPSIGLWQIRSLHAHTGTGRVRDRRRLFDPEFNARSMAVISEGGSNWQPWSVWPSPARGNLARAREVVAGVAGDAPPDLDPGGPPAASPAAGSSGLSPLHRGILASGGLALLAAAGVTMFGDDAARLLPVGG